MGTYLNHTIFLDWKEFIVNELRHTKIGNERNLFSSQDFLNGYREDILNEARYILGMCKKGSMIDWERRYFYCLFGFIFRKERFYT